MSSSSRATKVCVVVTPAGGLLLIASLSTGTDTLVITVDQASGELVHRGVEGRDVFSSEEEALHMVRTRLCGGKALTTIVRGQAFLGLVLTPLQAMVLVAVEVRRDPLPAGHSVCTVVKSQWVRAHAACAPFSAAHIKADDVGVERLREFAVSGHHFYSETTDLSRPFPSTHAPTDYDPEYCWNQWLAGPFERAGLRSCCVVLLQGLGCSRCIACNGGNISLAVITRKSIANPGTRYNARGLNDVAGAGNELESEQVVWLPSEPGAASGSAGVQGEVFSTYLWRRGTVPVHWRHEMTSTLTAPKMVINENPYVGVADFFAACHARYSHLMGMQFDDAAPLTVVNLLRCDPESGETGLSEVFQQSLREARSQLAERGLAMRLTMCNFDWHRLKKEIGLQSTVRGLWDRLRPTLEEADFTEGIILPCAGSAGLHGAGGGGPRAGLHAWQVQIEKRQRSLLRFNCADSLDRTNLCCFMVSQQLLLEQCRRLGRGLRTEALEDGSRLDLKAPWAFLTAQGFQMDHVKQAFEERLLEWLAEAYVRNGDIFSQLYTSTPALATGAIREYTTLPPAQSDALISTQRRYHNVLGDADRQCQYLLLLGRHLPKLLPSQASHASRAPRVFSAPDALLLQPVACTQSLAGDGRADFVAQVLDPQASEVGWLSPGDIDVLDACISLRLPCIASEVQLTVKNGISSSEFPSVLSIWVGPYADSMTQVYGNLTLPRCDDGTRLSFPLPAQLTTAPARELAGGQVVPETLAVPDYYEDEWWRDLKAGALSRVVRVQLGRAEGATCGLILGRISVLGVAAGGPWGGVEVGEGGDSGLNLLANRVLAHDALLGAERPVGYESVGNMVEKKLADNASREIKKIGGKALAKADEFVGKYAGDDSKLSSLAQGAFSSISKFGGWMGKKAGAGGGGETRGVQGGGMPKSTPAPAAAAGLGAAQRTFGGEGAGAAASAVAGAMPEWMFRGGMQKGAGDVASQLAAMWGQQAAHRAWGTQDKDSVVTERGPASQAAAPDAQLRPAAAVAAAARDELGGGSGLKDMAGVDKISELEAATMAQARGARNADVSAVPGANAGHLSGAEGAAVSPGGAQDAEGAVLERGLDPLGGQIMVHGRRFGSLDGLEAVSHDEEGGALAGQGTGEQTSQQPSPQPTQPSQQQAKGAEQGAGVKVQIDDAHVSRAAVCSLALAARRTALSAALVSLRASSQSMDASADLHRAVAGAHEDGHNKGGRKTESGRVSFSSHACEAVLAAAMAVALMRRVVEGYHVPRNQDDALDEVGEAGAAGLSEHEGARVVSEFPEASVVVSVPTAPQALPIETCLMPLEVLAGNEGCWTAPEGVCEVQVHIALTMRASVSRIDLVAPEPMGFAADEGMCIRVALQEYLVHGASTKREQWEWDVAAAAGEAAAPGTVLSYRPASAGEAPAVGRLLCLHVSVAKGHALRLGRVRVWGMPAISPSAPPASLTMSPECVAHTTLAALLQTRVGAAPLRGVRATLKDGGCGGLLGACNGEGIALELVVEAGTPIVGFALELRPLAVNMLPQAAGSAAAAMQAALANDAASPPQTGTAVPQQPAEACLMVLEGGGGGVGGRGACDVRMDVRLPQVLAPATLYYALPAPAVAGHVSLLLGRTYDGGWANKSTLKNVAVLLYTFKGAGDF